MTRNREIPGWAWLLVGLFVLFFVVPFIGGVFRSVPLAFFILWVVCPCLAWGLRSPSLVESLTPHGYSAARGVFVACAVAISFLFFAHYDFLRDQFGQRYLDGYSVYYFKDVDEFGRPLRAADASADSFSGKALLYLSQWVTIGMCIVIPVLTWKTASASISLSEKRKRESNNAMNTDK